MAITAKKKPAAKKRKIIVKKPGFAESAWMYEQLLGKPVSKSVNTATWPCPFCGHESNKLSLFINKKGEVKHKCWACNAYGDLCDLLKELSPSEHYGQRLLRVEALRGDYAKWRKSQNQNQSDTAEVSSLTGEGVPENTGSHSHLLFRSDIFLVWEIVRDDHGDGIFKTLLDVFRACHGGGISIEELLQYHLNRRASEVEEDIEHAAGCIDYSCKRPSCRARRGLPPVTRKIYEKRFFKIHDPINFKAKSKDEEEGE